jgi:hypothetical protein
LCLMINSVPLRLMSSFRDIQDGFSHVLLQGSGPPNMDGSASRWAAMTDALSRPREPKATAGGSQKPREPNCQPAPAPPGPSHTKITCRNSSHLRTSHERDVKRR